MQETKKNWKWRTSMWSCYSWAHWRCKATGLSWDMGLGSWTDSAWETPIPSPWGGTSSSFCSHQGVADAVSSFPQLSFPWVSDTTVLWVSHNLSECCCCLYSSLLALFFLSLLQAPTSPPGPAQSTLSLLLHSILFPRFQPISWQLPNTLTQGPAWAWDLLPHRTPAFQCLRRARLGASPSGSHLAPSTRDGVLCWSPHLDKWHLHLSATSAQNLKFTLNSFCSLSASTHHVPGPPYTSSEKETHTHPPLHLCFMAPVVAPQFCTVTFLTNATTTLLHLTAHGVLDDPTASQCPWPLLWALPPLASSATHSYQMEVRAGLSCPPGGSLHPAEGSVLPEDPCKAHVKALSSALGTLCHLRGDCWLCVHPSLPCTRQTRAGRAHGRQSELTSQENWLFPCLHPPDILVQIVFLQSTFQCLQNGNIYPLD